MTHRIRMALPLSVALLLTMLTCATTTPAADEKKAGKDVFGLDKLWSLHIDMPQGEYDSMQPKSPPGFFPFGGPPQPQANPNRDVDKSQFGTEFPYAVGDLVVEGRRYDSAGIRYKGNSSYMAAAKGLKRSIKIEFDHYYEGDRFHGMKTLNLNCGLLDPSRIREAFAYSVYRDAGVPAPRTAFAEVTLSVPGKYNRELLGTYTMIEHVDRTFLKAHFKNGKGLLMKPERQQQLPHYGDDWARYNATYQPKHEPTPEQARQVIEFTKLITRGSDEEFARDIGKFLDIDAFLRYLAATAMVANLDSFFSLGHNYYLYLNPDNNKFVFFPWDVDLSMGNFAMMATAEQQMELSLKRPYGSANRLPDRLMAMPEVAKRYAIVAKEVAEKAFTREKLLRTLETLEAVTKAPLERDVKAATARRDGLGGPPGGAMFGKTVELRTFVEKRAASVEAQVAGTSTGRIPGSGMFGGPGPAKPLTSHPWAKPLLEASDGNRDGRLSKAELKVGVERFFTTADTDKSGKIDEKQLASALTKAIPQGPGAGPAPMGPNVFGIGTFFAPGLMKKADTDRDGKATMAELLAIVEAAFVEVDKEKKGQLEEKDIAAAIGIVFAPPRP